MNIMSVASDAAREASKILREGFGKEFEIMNKEGRNNLVTEYDYRSEKAIIEMLTRAYPDSSVLAEESGIGGNPDGKLRWIVDPLDGTVNFAHKLPVFCVSIAAEINGEIIAAAICHPILDELFTAEKGGGCFLNGKKVEVSAVSDFESSFLVTGFPYNIFQNPDKCLNSFTKIVGSGIPVRRLGSAALDLAYVAMGRFDGFWELNLNPWDTAAGMLLVEEAGGKVTRYDGSAYTPFDNNILATNGSIHDRFMEVLMSCRSENCDVC